MTGETGTMDDVCRRLEARLAAWGSAHAMAAPIMVERDDLKQLVAEVRRLRAQRHQHPRGDGHTCKPILHDTEKGYAYAVDCGCTVPLTPELAAKGVSVGDSIQTLEPVTRLVVDP